jgi:hypothetical protein
MGNVDDLLVLLALTAVAGLWLKLSAARERAVAEAQRQCERYGLQLLDDSVGLRALRVRRVAGWLRLERGYGFELSIDGADRQQGLLWMQGTEVSELRLPTLVPATPEAAAWAGPARAPSPPRPALPDAAQDHPTGDNVVPLRPRRRSAGDDRAH